MHAFTFVNFVEYGSAKRGVRFFSFWFENFFVLEPKRNFLRACFQNFRNHFLLICGSSFPDGSNTFRMPVSLFELLSCEELLEETMEKEESKVQKLTWCRSKIVWQFQI
ncbi:hypothetical protein HR13_03495 [Porphyromonas gulae]|nr:hypothetical protein HR13_03495 [Porphyromonas gulae]